MLFSKRVAEELECGRRGGRGPESDRLQRVAGTNAFNLKQKRDLGTHRAWLGPPTCFVTVTCSSLTSDNMASWVMDQARLRGLKVDVITTRDERLRFPLREGFPQQPTVQATYMVHSQSGGDWPANCPYHPGCHRESLANYAHQ